MQKFILAVFVVGIGLFIAGCSSSTSDKNFDATIPDLSNGDYTLIDHKIVVDQGIEPDQNVESDGAASDLTTVGDSQANQDQNSSSDSSQISDSSIQLDAISSDSHLSLDSSMTFDNGSMQDSSALDYASNIDSGIISDSSIVIDQFSYSDGYISFDSATHLDSGIVLDSVLSYDGGSSDYSAPSDTIVLNDSGILNDASASFDSNPSIDQSVTIDISITDAILDSGIIDAPIDAPLDTPVDTTVVDSASSLENTIFDSSGDIINNVDSSSVDQYSSWETSADGPIQSDDAEVIITNDSGSQWSCFQVTCSGKLLKCGDCIDNDGDGKIDSQDPECLGPCDNTEGPTLEPGIGGTTASTCKVDCYFDYGVGGGGDSCAWNSSCDPLEPKSVFGCDYDPSLLGTDKCPLTQPQSCVDACMPITPNGCDCFGCCTFPALAGLGPNQTDAYVFIGAMDAQKNPTCTLADITDTTKCPRCTPVTSCLNTCGKCELCVGKSTVPPECYTPPGQDAGVSDSSSGYDAGVNDGAIYYDSSLSNDGASSYDSSLSTDGTTSVDGAGSTDGASTADSGPSVDSTAVDAYVPPQQCEAGIQPCGLPGQDPCPIGAYCITGCCINVIGF